MIILFYYVFHGWNVASIAYQFGMSSKTVYTHIYKAKKKNGISGKISNINVLMKGLSVN
ncbi:TPA: sigma factor-like helix-turn-helix DNA-binding protein [Escherichia coli]|nr:sigma-70 region 4 domain-containing protein [Escherichia coli]UKM88674.1 sigma-70 region 4 domain-containing protein [Escherichia coli]